MQKTLRLFSVIISTVLLIDGDQFWALGQENVNGGLDYQFEKSDFMRHSAYRNVKKLDREDSLSGAYGPVNIKWDETHEGKWYIELQRNGGDLVDGGIAANNTEAIYRGLHIIRWGFEQQQPDGSFDCPDAFHSTSFFVESTAHALLLLRAAGLESKFQSDFDYMLPVLHNAALWMIRPDIESAGKAKNAPYTHRRYLVGDALGETGVLLHDNTLIKESHAFIREGLSMQDPTGYNPEKGGYDSSYDAVGLLFAERYYAYVASGPLRDQLYNMLRLGVAWEASRVTPDGKIISTGNSRVGGVDPERDRTGKPKKPDVGQVFRAFAYWSIISKDNSYLQLAKLVAAAYRMSNL